MDILVKKDAFKELTEEQKNIAYFIISDAYKTNNNGYDANAF